MDATDAIIPVPAFTHEKAELRSVLKLVRQRLGRKAKASYHCGVVELAYALTFHKVQGCTLDRIVLDLNNLLGLDLGSIMGSGQPVNTFVYDLVGVIEHQGESINSGVFHWRQCDCIVTSSFCVQDTTLQKSDIYHPVGLVVGTC